MDVAARLPQRDAELKSDPVGEVPDVVVDPGAAEIAADDGAEELPLGPVDRRAAGVEVGQHLGGGEVLARHLGGQTRVLSHGSFIEHVFDIHPSYGPGCGADHRRP